MKKKNRKNVAHSVGLVFGLRPSCGIWPSGAFGRASLCQPTRRGGGGAPRRGHRTQRDRDGTNDEVRGGDWFELEESKGEVSDMEEGRNLIEAMRHQWGGGFRR
jgi:hypothetical protein